MEEKKTEKNYSEPLQKITKKTNPFKFQTPQKKKLLIKTINKKNCIYLRFRPYPSGDPGGQL